MDNIFEKNDGANDLLKITSQKAQKVQKKSLSRHWSPFVCY